MVRSIPMTGPVSMWTTDGLTPLEDEALRVFETRLEERCPYVPDTRDSEEFAVVAGTTSSNAIVSELISALDLHPIAEPEGYLLHIGGVDSRTSGILPEGTAAYALICGADSAGVLYGLGRLLRLIDFENGRSVGQVSEVTYPVGKQRGAYLATHFNNWYEGASVEEVARYVEDLALWGMNTIWTWFDMNWYPADFWKHPDSRGMRMIAKIRGLNETARRLGMTVGLTGLANEGFADQPPPELRADPSVKRGGFYPYSQICPSKPGGLDMILENRRKVLELIGPIDAFWYWPYDQGGCGCPDCADKDGWIKTFLKIGPEVARVVKEMNPSAKFIVSTWYLNDAELALVYREANRSDRWFDGLLMETQRAGEPRVPADMSLSVFPEVSMFECFFASYGCNGANPAPVRFTQQARRIAQMGYGAVLYSEGVYEDINKVVWAATMWDPDRAARDIVSEYCHYYFGSRNAETATELVLGLEETWGVQKLPTTTLYTARRLMDMAESIGDTIPDPEWCQWRWQALRDRAQLDYHVLKVGPGADLLREVKRLFDDAGFSDNPVALRDRVIRVRDMIAERESGIRDLFDAYWAYLERFHLDRSVLVFRPDQYLGSVDYSKLLDGLNEALAEPDDEDMRRLVVRAIHRWFWFNGVGIEFLFL